MQNMLKNYFPKVLVLFILITGLLCCSLVSLAEEEEMVRIGITQYVEHPALDSARNGFKDVLTENGYIEDENIKYDFQNAQGDIPNGKTIAQKFNRKDLDLILAIATPTAQAAANTISDTPILITAVTDPIEIGLESLEKPGINVSGTTDLTPIANQIKLIQKLVPGVETIGTIYNAGEANSRVQLEITKKACEDLGIDLKEATADSTANIMQAVRSLAGKVDALYVFTDNTVVSAIDAVVKVAEDNQLPLIVGEESGLAEGALATEGINYYELGRQTGKMALRILEEGAEVETMPIESQEKSSLVLNLDAAEKLNLEISDELIQKASKIYFKGAVFERVE